MSAGRYPQSGLSWKVKVLRRVAESGPRAFLLPDDILDSGLDTKSVSVYPLSLRLLQAVYSLLYHISCRK